MIDASPRRPRSGRRTLRNQIVSYLALAIAPAVALAVANGARTYQAQAEAAESAFLNAAIVDAQRERDAFVAARVGLRTLAAQPALAEFGTESCDAALRAFAVAQPEVSLVTAIDLDGVVRCASMPQAIGHDYSGTAVFQAFNRSPQFTVDLVRDGGVTGERVVVAVEPLIQRGELRGLLGVSLPVEVVRFLGRGPSAGEAPNIRGVVDEKGQLVLTADSDAEDAQWLPSAAEIGDHLAPDARFFEATAADGRERVYAMAPLIYGEAWLIAGARARDVYAGLLERAAPAMAAPMLALLIAMAVAYVTLDRFVVRHVIYLGRMTRVYGRGRLDLRPNLPDAAPEELAALGDDLGRMAESMDERQHALKRSAEINRALLLEVHHRVKNNLQMIASLVSLQVRRSRSDGERDTLERLRARIQSIALVHEKLYGATDLNRVPVDELVSDIARELAEFRHGPNALRAALSLDLDPVTEPPERATPLALFANEAITNALKHCCSHGEDGEIRVILRSGEDGGYELRIENSVSGDPPEDDGGGLGARLMSGFARQLRGEFARELRDGRHVAALRVSGSPAAAEADAAQADGV